MAGKADANGALTITFLEQQIHVRPGTAALALANNACVLPILSELSPEEHACFRIEPDLSVDLPKNKSEAYLQLMRALYHALQTQVLAHPQRWEEWWLLPHWLAKAPSTEFSRTPRPNYVVTMPGLVRARLALPDTGCWLLHERTRDNNGHEHEVPLCFDLANTQIDTCSPVFADLFQAARKQEQARTWLCRQQDQAQARALLQNELRSGRIVLRRDTPEQTPT